MLLVQPKRTAPFVYNGYGRGSYNGVREREMSGTPSVTDPQTQEDGTAWLQEDGTEVKQEG